MGDIKIFINYHRLLCIHIELMAVHRILFMFYVFYFGCHGKVKLITAVLNLSIVPFNRTRLLLLLSVNFP